MLYLDGARFVPEFLVVSEDNDSRGAQSEENPAREPSELDQSANILQCKKSQCGYDLSQQNKKTNIYAAITIVKS